MLVIRVESVFGERANLHVLWAKLSIVEFLVSFAVSWRGGNMGACLHRSDILSWFGWCLQHFRLRSVCLYVRLDDRRANFHIQSRVSGTGSAACGPRPTAAEKTVFRTEKRNKQLKVNKYKIHAQKYTSYCSLQEHSINCPLQTAPLLSCSCSVSRWGKVLQASDWLVELVHGVRVQELRAQLFEQLKL